MSMSVNSLMSTYTYGYGTGAGTRPKLDKNDDGYWNREELSNYADAYNKATGKTINVDKLMENYADSAGRIDYTAQKAIIKEDALDLRSLKPETTPYKSSAPSAGSKAAAAQPEKSTSEILSDLMANMSTTQKVSFSSKIFKYEQQGNLFNMFNSSSPALDFANMVGLGNKAGGTINWSSYMGQMMNLVV